MGETSQTRPPELKFYGRSVKPVPCRMLHKIPVPSTRWHKMNEKEMVKQRRELY